MEPVIILGTAPARPGEEAWLPATKSARKLAELAGCSPNTLGTKFGLENLVRSWAWGETPSRKELRQAGLNFRPVRGFRFLLAGTEVARALGKRALPAQPDPDRLSIREEPPLLRWYEARMGATIAVVPHPLPGRNRWYKPNGREELVKTFLQSCAWRGPGRANDMWKNRTAD